jgi:hypothetical protein
MDLPNSPYQRRKMKRITFLTALFPLLFGLFGIATVRADETPDKVRQGLGLGFATLSTSS